MLLFHCKYSKLKQAVSLLAIATFLFLLVNNSIFIHTHITSDGQKIVHSHLATGNGKAGNKSQHHHTNFEFLLISFVNAGFTALVFFFLLQFLASNKYIFVKSQHFYIPIADQSTVFLRAPPTFQ